MASKGEEDPLEVSSDWRAAGWGKAKLTVKINEAVDIKECYGDIYFLATVHSIPGVPEVTAESSKRAYASEVQFEEQLKELKFPPPENGRQGGIVDWYKRDGELRWYVRGGGWHIWQEEGQDSWQAAVPTA